MKIHYILATAYCPPKEKGELVKTLKTLLAEDARIEEKTIEPEPVGGVFTKELVELTLTVKRQKQIRKLLDKVLNGLDEYDRSKLFDEAERYVDSGCNFYLRLSKEEAGKGHIVLENSDPIHLRFKIASYPASKGKAVKSLREHLKK